MDDTLRTVCKKLIMNSIDIEEQQFLYMVDKCPNFSVCCVDQNASVLGSGSYHQVYSSKTNLIYHNRKCAECHNQREVTLFEAAIQCGALKES